MDPDDLATLSPLITRTIRRFGDWNLDLTPPKYVVATRLDLAPERCSPPRRCDASAAWLG
ncbi:hypothetical protein [Streptomyces sp. CBMA152]|uniref:hypothetical protein n=1 Tax=Streptomyces sp. CBMA152 TaxID=1896312 RepID=UPI001661558D|nr:hypothetical protein [Streptomyces sp. CBMA152]MBD0742531.1 hypothetical protein [Streptomyces sp. CBMA152]